MRTIGKLEKKIIDVICSKEETSIAQLLCDNIPDLILRIDNIAVSPGRIELIFINTIEVNEKAFSQTKQVVYILSFIKYLEEEGYVLSGYFGHGRVASGYFSRIENIGGLVNSPETKVTTYQFPDEDIRIFIFTYADRLILPTYHLLSFKARGYRTEEDRKHSQVLWVTWVGIAVAVILGVLSLFRK